MTTISGVIGIDRMTTSQLKKATLLGLGHLQYRCALVSSDSVFTVSVKIKFRQTLTWNIVRVLSHNSSRGTVTTRKQRGKKSHSRI